MREVKRYWPEEIVGTGELVVYAEDYAALEAECEHLRNSMLRLVTMHCAAAMKSHATDAELEQYLAAGIAQLEAERDALAAELDRVSRELSCLQSVIAEPDELNAEPASDYETLRRQYLSLRLLTNSALARNRYLCRRDDRDMRAALSVNAANVSAERDTNAMLTDLLEKAEAERDALHAETEALRVALHEIASVNPAQRGIEWAKSYASDGLNGAGSELYARWLETFKEAEALRAENARLRAALEQSRDLIVEMSKHCNATALVADWLERNT